MALTPNKNISALELLDSCVTYSGWLKKYGENRFGNHFHQRYCVIHNGYFFYFVDHNSKSSNGVFSLAGYRASETNTKKHKFPFMVEYIGFSAQRTYHFVAGSQREQMEWINHLNNEVCRIFPASIQRGIGDGHNDSDDEEEEKAYNYTQPKPDDVSFFDPERLENHMFHKNDDNVMAGDWGGPKIPVSIQKSNQIVPEAPPRPVKPVAKTVKPVLSVRRPSGSYEVNQIKNRPLGAYEVNIFKDRPVTEKVEAESLQGDDDKDCYEEMSGSEKPNELSKLQISQSEVDNTNAIIYGNIPPPKPKPRPSQYSCQKYVQRISRLEAEDLLWGRGLHGSFICRPSSDKVNNYTLSVRKDKSIIHVKIDYHNGVYSLYDGWYPSLTQLIDHFMKHELCEADGTVIELKYPMLGDPPVRKEEAPALPETDFKTTNNQDVCDIENEEEAENMYLALTESDPLPNSEFQWNVSRDQAECLLHKTGTVGVYLIRRGKAQKHVLSMLANNMCRHYLVFQEEGLLFLQQDPEPSFKSVQELIRYYRENNLPTCNVRLSVPYSE